MKLIQFKRLRNVILIFTAAILALSACAQAAQSDIYSQIEPPMTEKSFESPAEAPAPGAPAFEMEAGSLDNRDAQTQERMVIKNANLTVIVPDPAVSMDRIARMAEEKGGYVVSTNMYKQTLSSGIEVPRVTISIRVPAEDLNEALAFIRAESDQDPENERVNSQDITNEYVDLQSRLKNLEAAEVELTRIMQDARRTEDVLSVYNQLVQIREQIEVIKGQMTYFERSAELSSISIELIADKAVQPIEIGGWRPEGVAKEAIETLIRTMRVFATAAIWAVIYLLPVLLVLFIVFVLPPWLIFRSWRKRRANQKRSETESKQG